MAYRSPPVVHTHRPYPHLARDLVFPPLPLFPRSTCSTWVDLLDLLALYAACGANTYSLGGTASCTSCLTGSSAGTGASACACNVGYYSSNGFSTSTACTRTPSHFSQGQHVLPDLLFD